VTIAKRRIAVLGGGVAGLSTAWHLTNDRHMRMECDITVYEMDGVLGGKCASVRDNSQGSSGRNYEHGLHVFSGFYHNSFAMLRECYTEWGAQTGLPVDFSNVLVPHDEAVLQDRTGHDWHPVAVRFPRAPGQPGLEPPDLSPAAIVVRMLGWMILKGAALFGFEWRPKAPKQGALFLLKQAEQLAHLVARSGARQRSPARFGLDDLVRSALLRVMKLLLTILLQALNHIKPRDPRYPEAVIAAIGLIAAIGIVKDELDERGFDAINDQELTAWLKVHGANDRIINSPFIRGGYDYAFAFDKGDTARPMLAAGAGLRAFLRQHFTYNEAFFYHLNGGTGELLFVPLYEVLARRGVKFAFYHRVEALRLSQDGLRLARIEGVTLPNDTPVPEPVEDWKGRRTWPRSRRIDPSRLTKSFALEEGTHFDSVVLAIPAAAQHALAADLTATHPRWQTMLGAVSAIPTVSAQIWVRVPPAGLPANAQDGQLITAYAQPLSTFADMSFMLDFEHAPETTRLAYLCGPWPEGAGLDEAKVKAWISEFGGHLMPEAVHPLTQRFDLGLLDNPYIVFNMAATELYNLSPPGQIRQRLGAADSGVSNLLLAGDWTRNGLDIGCVEAAVMSGMQCAKELGAKGLMVVGETDKRQ
jgi:uncharacterized protein with NAD-binding domain and iron-sulfur cluster